MTDEIWQLDTHNPEQLAAYEHAFFQAFAPLTHNRLIHKLWLWDHPAQRLATRISYDQQIILVHSREDGTIDGAFAVNLLGAGLQSAFYGFALPEPLPAPASQVCEFLVLFSLAGSQNGSLPLKHVPATFAFLRQRGLRWAYATTARKVLPYYLRMGAKILETKHIENEARFFLQFELR